MIFWSDFFFFQNLSLQLGSEGFKLFPLGNILFLDVFWEPADNVQTCIIFVVPQKLHQKFIGINHSARLFLWLFICQVFNSFCFSSLKNYSLVNQNFELSLIIISFLFLGNFFYSVDLCLILVMFVQLLFKSKITNPHNADFKPLHIPSSKSATNNLVT